MERIKQAMSILSVCLLGMSLLGCDKQNVKQENNSYKTLKVSLSSRTVYSSFPASMKGFHDVDVYPQISGKITQVCVEEGADIKKGQPLFIIDQEPYRSAVETSRANVKSAEAVLASAQITLDSKNILYNEGVISDYDLRIASNTLRQQRASLSLARAELKNALNNLSYTVVKSPVNGKLSMISVRVGSLVGPSMSTPLVTVSDNARIYAYFSMTEKQLLSMKRDKGNTNSILTSMPEVELVMGDGTKYSHKGTIDAISGIINTKTGSVTLRAAFTNPDGILRSGGQGDILFPYTRNNCIVIPQEATFELQDKVFVYKVVKGKTKSCPINVFPINNGKEYIVESGLSIGDVIIAEGAGLLRDGISVSD
ncbi:MAG: efflux RND transporter periplasmic adaptor subunit [Prevotella sp.]